MLLGGCWFGCFLLPAELRPHGTSFACSKKKTQACFAGLGFRKESFLSKTRHIFFCPLSLRGAGWAQACCWALCRPTYAVRAFLLACLLPRPIPPHVSHHITFVARFGPARPGPTRQTSLSESGQSKALIVLDAKTWKEKAVVPLDIGRRFFRVKGEHEPLPAFGEVRSARYISLHTATMYNFNSKNVDAVLYVVSSREGAARWSSVYCNIVRREEKAISGSP